MRQLLLTIFLNFLIFSLFGQEYYPPIENYSTNNYGKDRNPENYAIVQDKRGVMYFGNSNGVMEYDGKNWNFIEVVIGAYVYSISIDSSGVIYIGSNGDFGFLKSNNKGVLSFHSLLDKVDDLDQFFNKVNYTYTIGNEVFFQTERAVFIFNKQSEKIQTIKTDQSYHTSYEAGGAFYVRERDVGVKKWTGEELELVKGTDLFKEEPCFGIFDLDPKDEKLLFVTHDLGLYELDDKVLSLIGDSNLTLANIKVYGASLLSDGNFALRTFDKGVYIISEQGELLHKIDRSTGLRSADIKCMFEDRDQNLWLGLGNGISKVNYYSPLSFFNNKSGIEGNVQSFKRFQELLYVGTSFGLYIQDTLAESLKEFRKISSIRNQIWDFLCS